MKNFLKLILLFIVLALVAGASFFWFGKQYWQRPLNNQEQIVTIPKGSGFNAIVSRLKQSGIVKRPAAFKLVETVQHNHSQYKAGEYSIPANVTPRRLSEIIRSGKNYQRQVQLVEGTTVLSFMQQNNNLPGLVGEWPQVAEGSLLPETYNYTKGETKEKLIRRMQKAMQKAVLREWENRDREIPIKSPVEAVILASIVEKETAVAKERPLVASVFHNRLAKEMRLQSDPTIVYGIDKDGVLDRSLTKTDIKTETDYNTYTIDGLPPTAICNPGLDSIKAVLKPAESNYFYFVADGSGGHAFSRSLEDHNNNVVHWRKLEKIRNVPMAPTDTPSINLPSPADLVLPAE